MPGISGQTRVLTLITRMNIGGPAKHVLSLARSLPPDISMRIVAGRPTEVEGELSDPDIPIRSSPLVRPVAPRADLQAFRHTRGLLRGAEPDVLHTHMAKSGTIGRLAARSVSSTVRTVHTFHGHVLTDYFSPAVQRTFLQAERFLARRTDVLVAVSAEIRDQLLDLGIGRSSQYEVIPLGLDLVPFEDPTPGQLRLAIGIGPDVPLAGVAARLVPIKDHATLLRAVAAVPGLHLAILGDGECRCDLESLAAELGIDDRTHFTGWWHDMPSALVDLDIAVLTSRNEGTPIALMEAAACGLPIVATDVGGVSGMVEPDGNGFLVDPRDVDATTTHLRRLTDDSTLRKRLGHRSRTIAARIATEQDPTPQLCAIYRSLTPT